MTVTIIQDLTTEMPAAIFTGPATDAERANFFIDGKAEAGVNVFLLRAGGKIALFDTGTGTLFPSPGRLPEALAGFGVKPEDVDFIMLTHMHGDHVGGLLKGEARAFTKAKILVAKPEFDSWIALAEKAADESLPSKTAMLAKKVAAAFGADIQTFAFGDNPLPGITAIDAAGHTPGHTVYQLQADGKNLLIVGDLIHAMALQLAMPEMCAAFDMDHPRAVEARKRIFAFAAENGFPVAGMHFPFANAVGAVKKDGNGWKFERAQ
jgi:glyoxylase-like metal-dependent hydrolase (beta-lactamase superfamily II)